MPKHLPEYTVRIEASKQPRYASPHEAVGANLSLIVQLIREGQAFATQTQHTAEAASVPIGVKNAS